MYINSDRVYRAGYGSLGLFGLASRDFLALSDPDTEVIGGGVWSFLQVYPYLVVVIVCFESLLKV